MGWKFEQTSSPSGLVRPGDTVTYKYLVYPDRPQRSNWKIGFWMNDSYGKCFGNKSYFTTWLNAAMNDARGRIGDQPAADAGRPGVPDHGADGKYRTDALVTWLRPHLLRPDDDRPHGRRRTARATSGTGSSSRSQHLQAKSTRERPAPTRLSSYRTGSPSERSSWASS